MGGQEEKNKGYLIEKFVAEKFFDLNFKVDLRNCYYDLDLKKNNISRKVEIKSTNFIVRNGGGVMSYGRFYFDRDNIKEQLKNNVDVCFIICVGNCYEVIGFMNIHSVKEKFKAKRYIFLKDLMNCKLTRFNKYIDKFKYL